jgi:hypothetical protein
MPYIGYLSSNVKGSVEFGSLKKAHKLKRASAILAKYDHAEELTGDDLDFMRQVFESDTRSPGTKIKSIKIGRAERPYGMHRCFHVLTEDGWSPWSYQKALGKAKVAP